VHVLDASAFIHDYDVDGPTASIPAVREELEDAAAYRYDAQSGGGMQVQVPGDAAMAAVRDAAGETGDLDVLSETDTRLLAATYELGGTVVTDDYAVQNVADELGVGVDVIAQDGISERRDWNFQCQGCGREFDESRDRCPVCGSDLARKNPR
jgi:UPF0271 protein